MNYINKFVTFKCQTTGDVMRGKVTKTVDGVHQINLIAEYVDPITDKPSYNILNGNFRWADKVSVIDEPGCYVSCDS